MFVMSGYVRARTSYVGSNLLEYTYSMQAMCYCIRTNFHKKEFFTIFAINPRTAKLVHSKNRMYTYYNILTLLNHEINLREI